MLIPFASASEAPAAAQALRSLQLPHLERLLARLSPSSIDRGEAASLSMPHERVLARAAGIEAADGCLPLAALELEQQGRDPQGAAWAWITPSHWRVGTDHVAMSHPGELQLDEAGSRAALQAMRPFFEGDAIALDYLAPTRWLARGEIFRGLPTASLDRVAGRTIDAWMPRTPKAGTLRRLQQEMQMLLYTHALNDEREARGLLPLNSFWVSGAGALPAARTAPATPRLELEDSLREPALREDWLAWAAAWQALDVTQCAALSKRVDEGGAVSLVLCGDRSAQTWTSQAGGGYLGAMGARIAGIFGRKQAVSVLEQL